MYVNAQQFYQYICDYEDVYGVEKYVSLGNFAMQVLSLPLSNADAERLFYKYNLINRKERNSLHLGTVQALIHMNECAKNDLKDGTFEPDRDMLVYMSGN